MSSSSDQNIAVYSVDISNYTEGLISIGNYTYKMSKPLNGRKLFLALSLLGLVNVIIAYTLFYYSSVSLLEERSAEQLSSVRSLTSHKLKLFLENLKINAINNSSELVEGKIKAANATVLTERETKLSTLPPLQFVSPDDKKLLLKVPIGMKSVIWEFRFDSIDKVLSDYVGLGKSGEIYLVGLDQKIKSASRLVTNWQEMTVNNESIRLGKLYNTGVHVVKDYRNVDVLSAYSLFNYDRLHYILLSEIDKAEVFKPLKELFPKIFFICALLVLLSIGIAYYASRKLLELIENMRKQINSMHVQFVNALEEENKKIAFHLHDGVGQILTALKWGVDRKEDTDKLKTLCDEAFKEIRNVSGDLMPVELSELGFFPAIRNFIRRQEQFFKIPIAFWSNDRLEKFNFLPGRDVNLYRMIQEFLQNTLKHANASSISIVLFRENDSLVLRYEDDGIGVLDNAPLPRVILYRADLMEATVIRPKTDKGLAYQVTIPLKQVFSENV